MILLIDNYDSFSYNLYQLAASVEADIKVIRNDGYTVEEIEKMGPAALILGCRSPLRRPHSDKISHKLGLAVHEKPFSNTL